MCVCVAGQDLPGAQVPTAAQRSRAVPQHREDAHVVRRARPKVPEVARQLRLRGLLRQVFTRLHQRRTFTIYILSYLLLVTHTHLHVQMHRVHFKIPDETEYFQSNLSQKILLDKRLCLMAKSSINLKYRTQ